MKGGWGGGGRGERKRETDRKRREEWNTGLHRTLTLYSLCKDCTSIRMILRYKKKNVPSFSVNEKRSFFFFFWPLTYLGGCWDRPELTTLHTRRLLCRVSRKTVDRYHTTYFGVNIYIPSLEIKNVPSTERCLIHHPPYSYTALHLAGIPCIRDLCM